MNGTSPTLALHAITVHQLRLPLVTPYRLSYRTFESFEPFVVEAEGVGGARGFGEGHVSPGSSSETREGAWRFLCEMAPALPGLDVRAAARRVDAHAQASPVAASALGTALEMLAGHRLLQVAERRRLPLLAPVNGHEPGAIEAEIEARLAEGFRTFKVKVGSAVRADLERLAWIQQALAGRASLRIDANRAFDRADAMAFVAGMDARGIELFEQPCAAEDWEANAAVARVSPVPLMLDEPICSIADIDRAAALPGVGFCKLKLKRFGGIERLHAALRRVRERGMTPVLGDGLGAEPACWMEACVARDTIDNAGEFNGFLRPRERLFRSPLECLGGDLVLEPGAPPELDRDTLRRTRIRQRRWRDGKQESAA